MSTVSTAGPSTPLSAITNGKKRAASRSSKTSAAKSKKPSKDPVVPLQPRSVVEAANVADLVGSLTFTDLQDMMTALCVQKAEILAAVTARVQESSSPPPYQGSLVPAAALLHAHEIVQMMHPQSLRKTLAEPDPKSAPGASAVDRFCKRIMEDCDRYTLDDRAVVLFAVARCMRASLDVGSYISDVRADRRPIGEDFKRLYEDNTYNLSACLHAVFRSVRPNDYMKLTDFREGSNTLIEELGLIREHYGQLFATVVACAIHSTLGKWKKRRLTLTATQAFCAKPLLAFGSKEHPVTIK